MRLLVKAKDVYVEYKGKEVLNVEKLEIFESQKIGIVGKNGCGKTTLIKVLLREISFEGCVTSFGEFAVIRQTDEFVENAMLWMSHGEKTKEKIDQVMSTWSHGIFADEPTSFVDQDGIDEMINQFKYYPGALVIVSHDRYFLDEVVDVIWELEEGRVTVYQGNYSEYLKVKEQEQAVIMREYNLLLKQQEDLQRAITSKQLEVQRSAARNKRRKAKNNTNDGGRLSHQKDGGTKEKKLHQMIKKMEKKLEHLDIQKIDRHKAVRIKVPKAVSLNHKYPIVGRDVDVQVKDKSLLEKVNFEVALHQKIALIGKNGSGKSTLFKMIKNKQEGIHIASKVKIGYLSQNVFNSNLDEKVLSFVMESKNAQEQGVRAALNSVGFFKEDLKKRLGVLSGGEIMKLNLIKLMFGNYNVLLLDEPTNFLDIESREAVQILIRNYEGTVFFISHDRRLIEQTADLVYEIKDKKIVDVSHHYLGNNTAGIE